MRKPNGSSKDISVPLSRALPWSGRGSGFRGWMEKNEFRLQTVCRKSVFMWSGPRLPTFSQEMRNSIWLLAFLSQGKNSRLYKTLVYDKQIASDVSAFNYSLEISGVFGVIATARPGHSLDEIEKVIDDEISRFARNGPEEEELIRERAKQEFDFISGLERIGGFGGKSDLLNQYNTFLGSPDFFQRDYDRYQKCSRNQIRDVVRQYLDTRNRLVVSFVPEQSDRPKVTEIDRTKVPSLGDRKAFQPPTFSSKKLSNGLTVTVSERHELPKVAVSLVLKTGATADPATKSGVAWMTAEMLDEGTTSRSALQIQAELDRLGSSLHTSAGSESSEVNVEALKKNLKPTLQIMADLILHPTFPEDGTGKTAEAEAGQLSFRNATILP